MENVLRENNNFETQQSPLKLNGSLSESEVRQLADESKETSKENYNPKPLCEIAADKSLKLLPPFFENSGTSTPKVAKKQDHYSTQESSDLDLDYSIDIKPRYHREPLANRTDISFGFLTEGLKKLGLEGSENTVEVTSNLTLSDDDDQFVECQSFNDLSNRQPHNASIVNASGLNKAINAYDTLTKVSIEEIANETYDAGPQTMNKTEIIETVNNATFGNGDSGLQQSFSFHEKNDDFSPSRNNGLSAKMVENLVYSGPSNITVEEKSVESSLVALLNNDKVTDGDSKPQAEEKKKEEEQISSDPDYEHEFEVDSQKIQTIIDTLYFHEQIEEPMEVDSTFNQTFPQESLSKNVLEDVIAQNLEKEVNSLAENATHADFNKTEMRDNPEFEERLRSQEYFHNIDEISHENADEDELLLSVQDALRKRVDGTLANFGSVYAEEQEQKEAVSEKEKLQEILEASQPKTISPLTSEKSSESFFVDKIENNLLVEFKMPSAPVFKANTSEELKDEDFASGSSYNFAASDFDYLQKFGSNSRYSELPRDSVLSNFDPLLITHSLNNENRLTATKEEEDDFVADLELKLPVNEISSNDFSPNSTCTPAVENQEIEQLPVEDEMSVYIMKDISVENNTSETNHIEAEEIKLSSHHNEENGLKMAELENKIKKEAEMREEALLKRISEKDKQINKMTGVVEAYEKAISELIAEKEQLGQSYDKKCSDLKNDSEQNAHHLSSLETTFSDLHAKYERTKQIAMELKEREENIVQDKKALTDSLKMQEARYEKMKSHAMSQLEIANNTLAELNRNHNAEVTKLKALLKKEEISRASVNEQLIQKTKENSELVKICDELINGTQS